MSFVSSAQQKLILDLLLRRISEQDFFSSYPTSPETVQQEGLALLESATANEDGVDAEFGLYLTHRFGVTPAHEEPLNQLANAPFHQRHEDVVAALSKLKKPSSIEPLYRAALASC